MIEILEEPVGNAYKSLIALALEVCDEFMLVKRDQLPLDEKGRAFISRLEPYLLRVEKQESWPGTQLFGHYADVYYYRATMEVLDLLTTSVSGLYDWLQPALLEDLCFFRDQKEWLYTVSHEKLGFINHFNESDLLQLRAIEDFMFY